MEEKKKLKRMVYIYEENLDFYNELKNKSQFINDALQDRRIQGRIKTPRDVNMPQSGIASAANPLAAIIPGTEPVEPRPAGQAAVVDGVAHASRPKEETGVGMGEEIPEGHPAHPNLDPYANEDFINKDPRIQEQKRILDNL